MEIIEQIQSKFPFLTRKQREVADYMLEDIDRMSYVTLKEMSSELNITEMTILKTCSILGFSSFTDMKYEFRKYAARNMEAFRHPNAEYSAPRMPAYELDDMDKLLHEICQEEARLSNLFFAGLDIRKLFAAADMLLEGDKIVLCGRGVSLQICQYISTLLSVVGLGSIVINSELDDEVHRALPLITPETTVFVVSYPDYYRMTDKFAEHAHKKGIRVLLLTDSEKAPVSKYADLILTAGTKSRLFLNSIGNAMSLVNLLASAVNIRLSASTKEYGTIIEEFHGLFEETEA